MAASSAASAACKACIAETGPDPTAIAYPPSATTCVASEAAMLANSWASAGGTVASRRTRSVADALSAARSRAMLTRPGEVLDEVLGEVLDEADAVGAPRGRT